MLKFYYNTAPNPMKVALFLEEAGLPYEPVPLDTRRGDQHKPDYQTINPNARERAIVDDGVVVFDCRIAGDLHVALFCSADFTRRRCD